MRTEPVVPCKDIGCEGRLIARGMCPKHYARWRALEPLDPKNQKGAPLACAGCGVTVSRTSAGQRYCSPCGDVASLKRKGEWARKRSPQAQDPRVNAARTLRRKELGALASSKSAEAIGWDATAPLELAWSLRVSVPFSYGFSKNHVYSMTKHGHVFLAKRGKELRDGLVAALKAGARNQRVFQHKLWVDVLVQKPNHRGDAVNVLDMVCDAIKRAIPLDDRWYSVRRLDWQIVKSNPRLFVGISQEEVEEDHRVCSICGLVGPVSSFGKSSVKHKRRECPGCRSAVRRNMHPRRPGRASPTPAVYRERPKDNPRVEVEICRTPEE